MFIENRTISPEVPAASHARVKMLADKIVELSVRTIGKTDDVVREGSYMNQGYVSIGDYNVEISTVIFDKAVAIGDYSGPRFGAAVGILMGKANNQDHLLTGGKPKEGAQRTLENIRIAGGEFEEAMWAEVGPYGHDEDEKPQEKHPMTFEYESCEDHEMKFDVTDQAKLSEEINALVLSFWIRYGLEILTPSDELWAEIHLSEDVRFSLEHGLIPGVSDTGDEDHDSFVDSLDVITPPEDPFEREYLG